MKGRNFGSKKMIMIRNHTVKGEKQCTKKGLDLFKKLEMLYK